MSVIMLPTWGLEDIVFNTVEDDGTEWIVHEDEGWDNASGPRLAMVEKTVGHGAYDSRSYMEPRTIVLTGCINAPDRAASDRALRRLAALGSKGDKTTLTVTEPDGVLTSSVRLAKRTETRRLSTTAVEFQLSLIAPDPVKHGAERSASTSLPLPGTGLDWQAGMSAVTRTNLAPNPSLEASTSGWSAYNAGSSFAQVILSTPVPGIAAGAMGGRATCTTAGNYGASHTFGGITADQYYTASVYVKPTVTRDMRVYLEWRDAAGTSLVTNFATTGGVAAGAWSRIQINRVAPAGAVTLLASPVAVTGALNETFEWDAVLVELSSDGALAGDYFDGGTPPNSWASATHNSPSYNAPVGLNWLAGDAA